MGISTIPFPAFGFISLVLIELQEDTASIRAKHQSFEQKKSTEYEFRKHHHPP
jgi:hypothetical protein